MLKTTFLPLSDKKTQANKGTRNLSLEIRALERDWMSAKDMKPEARSDGPKARCQSPTDLWASSKLTNRKSSDLVWSVTAALARGWSGISWLTRPLAAKLQDWSRVLRQKGLVLIFAEIPIY